MKEIIGLLIFIIITSLTIYFIINKKLEAKYVTILLLFSIVAGFTIANYNSIFRMKFGELELETAKKEIITIKDSALQEISREIDEQKESIKFLITNANDTREKLELQNNAVLSVIEAAKELQTKINNQKDRIFELNDDAEKTKKEIEALNQASAQIALILVRATYFTLETKSEFGTDRAQAAIQEMLNDLNTILPMVIPNENERNSWIQRLQNTLPQRN